MLVSLLGHLVELAEELDVQLERALFAVFFARMMKVSRQFSQYLIGAWSSNRTKAKRRFTLGEPLHVH